MKFSTVFVSAFAAYAVAAPQQVERRANEATVNQLGTLLKDVVDGVNSVSGSFGTNLTSIASSKGVKLAQRDIDEEVKRGDPGIAKGVSELISDVIADLSDIAHSTGVDIVSLIENFIPKAGHSA